jgi:magnesium chelatase subunit H
LRRHGRLHVRRRGHAPDAHGQVRHGRPAERADGAAEEAPRGAKANDKNASERRRQMAMLRRIPKMLRFIPGTAQDVRAYFLLLQYWLAGSDENIANMVRMLVDRYRGWSARGAARHAQGRRAGGVSGGRRLPSAHEGRITDQSPKLPSKGRQAGTVGLLVMRSYVLAGNTGHYDGVIKALEARGLRVIPAFASGLDARPAIEQVLFRQGQARASMPSSR